MLSRFFVNVEHLIEGHIAFLWIKIHPSVIPLSFRVELVSILVPALVSIVVQ